MVMNHAVRYRGEEVLILGLLLAWLVRVSFRPGLGHPGGEVRVLFFGVREALRSSSRSRHWGLCLGEVRMFEQLSGGWSLSNVYCYLISVVMRWVPKGPRPFKSKIEWSAFGVDFCLLSKPHTFPLARSGRSMTAGKSSTCRVITTRIGYSDSLWESLPCQ